MEAAYRNSPYFEYYEDEIKPFFEAQHTHHFQLGLQSVKMICDILQIDFNPSYTDAYEKNHPHADLRNAWNKQDYSKNPPVSEFPEYIQVFSDRHPFSPDLSILDLLFCIGPNALQYLKKLKLREY